MSKIIGIDLGTTNSCVAVIEGGEAVVIPNAEGERTTPSVIAFTEHGERLVGQVALRQAVTNPQGTVTSIKREMGSNYRFKAEGKSFNPAELSAIILSKLKKDAESYLGEEVKEAVITVPAYFSDAQRQATKDAGTIAGLNVKRIINEPTAAALAYGVDKEEAKKVLVFDLGGGTFDVSILDIKEGVIEVIATAGDNKLGGDDFDACITDELLKVFEEKYGVNLRNQEITMQRIKEAARKAKEELSFATTTLINLPYLAQVKGEQVHLEYALDRAKFERLSAPLIERTKKPVLQAIEDAHIKKEDIGKVILVGGSTRIPAVQNQVKNLTGKEGFKGLNPDECVAMGAALQGGVMGGEVTGLLLLDVTPLSLGIETVGGMCTRVIERNTTIPIAKSQVFTTAANFQPHVEIKVLQGERARANDNKLLGKFKLKGIQKALAGVPQIEVTFNIDANGIVNVSAKDQKTGKAQDITIESSENMSQAEIERAMEDAKRYASEDENIRTTGEVKSRLNQLILQASELQKRLVKTDKARGKEAKKELAVPIKKAMKQMRTKKEDLESMNQLVAELEAILSKYEN
ncbi:MAG TPA: molecular chaperone DnaK [Candidatus Dorea intestinavium]|nr:molecular chaperone DnaK [Candidatus Dorea intestinavium]